MNVFIKYHGKTVGPYGVGGFQRLNKKTRSNVETLVIKAAQENGVLPFNVRASEVMFVFENTHPPTYASC